ncbi:MAG: DUF2917 domain-containing protein [Rhodocyclales bacterium]|nr:DUF2917 domain-containing protein [Rhodocyclales bacterium]
MATITQETRFELAQRELVGIAKARGQTLRCDAGELWITVDGDAGDIILRSGEVWQIASNEEIVISALQASRLSVTHSQAFGSFADSARRMLFSLRSWEFPPLAAFPVQLIR